MNVLLGTPAATALGGLADAGTIKVRIFNEVCALVTQAVVGLRARNQVPSEVPNVTRPRRRISRGESHSSSEHERMRQMGFFDDTSEQAACSTPHQLPPEQEAENILNAWLAKTVGLGRILKICLDRWYRWTLVFCITTLQCGVCTVSTLCDGIRFFPFFMYRTYFRTC